MMFDFILAIGTGELMLNSVLFILLCFGSLLWPLSIVAVLWGFYDGFVPAIHHKEYSKAAVILLILLITCIIIVISLQKAVYLTAYIVPVALVYVYINKYGSSSEGIIITDYYNN